MLVGYVCNPHRNLLFVNARSTCAWSGLLEAAHGASAVVPGEQMAA
jgi:hypothetical protein